MRDPNIRVRVWVLKIGGNGSYGGGGLASNGGTVLQGDSLFATSNFEKIVKRGGRLALEWEGGGRRSRGIVSERGGRPARGKGKVSSGQL